MVIGFDGSRAFVKERTGTENYSYQLLRFLAKIDKHNQYIVYTRTQGDALRGWTGNFQFKVVKWPRFWTQGGLAIQTFKDPLDILFVPAHTLPVVRKPGLKTVLTVHDLGSEYLPKMHHLKQRIYLSYMQRYQLNSVTRIIAVSKATKEDLVEKIGIDPEKIEVVYEGYNKELFKQIKSDILVNTLRQYDLEAGKYFLFVGTVQPRKNLTKLILSFNQFCHPEGVNRPKDLDNLKLVIVGSKGWMSDEIYRLPKKLGIEDQVKFLGYVPDQDLPVLYSGAIALISPSLYEGFGLPILEAQACGCPVLTSNISSMPEVAGNGAILVNPYSVDDIVKGMKKMENGKWKMEKVKSGFENIKRFSWEKCAARTLEVFQNL